MGIHKMRLNSNHSSGRKKYIPGSITVEAAFVMPIVILAVFALIYLAFYLHDLCRIQGNVDLALHKAGLSVKHEADIATGQVAYEDINDRGVFYLLFESSAEEEAELKELLEQELSKGLFLVKIGSIKVEADKLRIKASVKTDMDVKLPLFSHLFNSLPDKVIYGEYPVYNPAETIRIMEVILETGSEIKGVKELKEKMKKLINSED